MSRNKKQNSLVQAWLILYNIAMTAGWSLICVGIVKHFMHYSDYKGLYNQVDKLLIFFQSCAVLEILHAIFGLVRSNVMLTTLQVFSRVGIVWGVIVPVVQVQDQIGITLLLIAWTITEIIRYLFYTFLLMGFTPYILLWLRYTLFIVLYPMGVSGELLSIYHSLKPVHESGMFSLTLPNDFNFAIDYVWVLIGTIPFYVIYFPQLYFHMFAQRRKQLAPQHDVNSTKKLN